MDERLNITPATKIKELIDAYPELEKTLVAMAPEFGKLRNPLLRNTIARITSLQQVSVIGKVDLSKMIRQLHKEAGLSDALIINDLINNNMNEAYTWFAEEKITSTLDARPMLAAGRHPVNEVFERLHKMNSGEILQFVSGFVPAPLIDKARDKGYEVLSVEETPDQQVTYFYKP